MDLLISLKRQKLLIAAVFLGLLTAYFIFLELYIYAFVLFIVLFFTVIKYEARIYFVLLSISFPFPIYLQGREIGTISTVLIFFIFFIAFLEYILRIETFLHFNIEKVIYFLVLSGFVSMSISSRGLLIPSIKNYLIFVSGLLLFLLIIKTKLDSEKEVKNFIEGFIDIILLLNVIQIIISFFVMIIPRVDIFLRTISLREITLLDFASKGGMNRFRNLLGGPEPTGEMLALLAPLVLYKYLTHSKRIYLLTFFIFAIGEILTATRSTIVLFVFGTIATLFLFSKKETLLKSIKVFIGACFILLLILVIWPDIFSLSLDRFSILQSSIERGEEFTSVLNRKFVWDNALSYLKDLKPFGHGFLPQFYTGMKRQFHSLYLTVIYQMGWIGASMFFLVLLWIYFKLYRRQLVEKDSQLKLLLTCCWISMTLFLINEIKYEFIRRAPYFQLYWALFGFYFFIASYQYYFQRKE
ncbi:MAG: O-antigen ligase family protein [Promethearchaeota archaeon]|jgi:hypothetical protein